MEELSRIGAKKIATLSIPERTKRAMLAEAIEDQIFENTERLESFLKPDGTLPPKLRERAVAVAQKTKALQVQYSELVSGKESSVLNALEAAMAGKEEDKSNEDE